MVVEISRVLNTGRVRTLAAVPLAFVPVLARKFDLFPRDTPNNEFLWRSWEKKGLCGGVDDVDVLNHVRRSEKRARLTERSKGHAVQLEEFHLGQLAFGV